MNPRLLIIDDEEGNLLTLSMLLEMEGFEVETAPSIAEAKTLLESASPYVLVILDLHLGDGLGLELVPALRNHSSEARILLVSGDAQAAAAHLADVDAVAVKGQAFPDFLRKVRGTLDS